MSIKYAGWQPHAFWCIYTHGLFGYLHKPIHLKSNFVVPVYPNIKIIALTCCMTRNYRQLLLTFSMVPATFSQRPTMPVMSSPGWFQRHIRLHLPLSSPTTYECFMMPSSCSSASLRRLNSSSLKTDLFLIVHIRRPMRVGVRVGTSAI